MGNGSTDDQPVLLFVYGTIRVVDKREGRRLSLGSESTAEVVEGEAYLDGFRMLDLGSYPGIIKTSDGGQIRGEIHRITEPTVYDSYEGYRPGDPKGSLYTRELVTIRTPGGRQYQDVWVYVFNHEHHLQNPADSYTPVVKSGDWFAEKGLYRVGSVA